MTKAAESPGLFTHQTVSRALCSTCDTTYMISLVFIQGAHSVSSKQYLGKKTLRKIFEALNPTSSFIRTEATGLINTQCYQEAFLYISFFSLSSESIRLFFFFYILE